MFKLLGQSFLDTFRKPFVLIFLFFMIILGITGFSLVYSYIGDYLLNSPNLFINTMSVLTTNAWVAVIYLIWIIVIAYALALYIAYVINKKNASKDNFKGSSKIFWFNLFLLLITYIPTYIFSMFGLNLVLGIIFMVISLIYIFLIYPFLFFVPILLPNMHLKEALSKSYNFAKKHYGLLILLQILFVAILTLLSNIVDWLSLIDEFLGLLLFIIIFTILVLWALYFIYNWFYSE